MAGYSWRSGLSAQHKRVGNCTRRQYCVLGRMTKSISSPASLTWCVQARVLDLDAFPSDRVSSFVVVYLLANDNFSRTGAGATAPWRLHRAWQRERPVKERAPECKGTVHRRALRPRWKEPIFWRHVYLFYFAKLNNIKDKPYKIAENLINANQGR